MSGWIPKDSVVKDMKCFGGMRWKNKLFGLGISNEDTEIFGTAYKELFNITEKCEDLKKYEHFWIVRNDYYPDAKTYLQNLTLMCSVIKTDSLTDKSKEDFKRFNTYIQIMMMILQLNISE